MYNVSYVTMHAMLCYVDSNITIKVCSCWQIYIVFLALKFNTYISDLERNKFSGGILNLFIHAMYMLVCFVYEYVNVQELTMCRYRCNEN